MRTLIKKVIYKTLGKRGYLKAYAQGKIRDINRGSLDEPEAQFLPHFIQKNSTVLDIGANYGHYAVDMARLCPNGCVHAFEPIPFTYAVLEKVVAHFNLTNTELYHAAVSNEKGAVEMTIPLLDFGAPNTGVAYIGKAENAQTETVKVDTIRIDDLTTINPVDFIKIDVEGHEPMAFKGMENKLKKDRPVILIEFSHPCLNRAGTAPNDFAHYLHYTLDYTFTRIDGKELIKVDSQSPGDGYYFLIPTEKIAHYSFIRS